MHDQQPVVVENIVNGEGEDDSLLFDFAERQVPSQTSNVPQGVQMHHHAIVHNIHHSSRQHSASAHQHSYNTVDVNLEELHREE